MGNSRGAISRRRGREQLFPTRDAAGVRGRRARPKTQPRPWKPTAPVGQGAEPSCHQRCSSRPERDCPCKILVPPDLCGKDRALPAGQTEAHIFGPVPVGGGQRGHGEQQRHWPQKDAASERTENREGKPASGSFQAPVVPVHFHVHTAGRWRAIPPSGRNFAFLRSISIPEPG